MKFFRIDKILINAEKILFIVEENKSFYFYIKDNYKIVLRTKDFDLDKLLRYIAISGENSDVVDLTPITTQYEIKDLNYGA
jgi:uncharacterized pyridoxamine 5'-phosphate oxidase family protein